MSAGGHALITGASSGIGESIARELASKGWRLTLVARRHDQLQALAQRLGPASQTFVRPCDLGQLEQCSPLVAEAVEALGPIDALINNAGLQYVEPVTSVTPERGELLFRVNVLAPMRLIHEVLPSMLERGAGHIVNIASLAGLIFTPGMCHYNASKAALGAASESLRVELAGRGVHVLTVYPGPVSSPMEAKARQAFVAGAAVSMLPTGQADALAALIEQAMRKQRARLIYPRVYGVSRHTRVLSQWLTDALTPPLKG